MAEPEQPQGHIVADEAYDSLDADSAVDLPLQSTASIRSSILQYQHENGRTYHALSSGQYVLPNDEGEQERLDLVNHLFTLTYEGRLCICPKNDGARSVLDMGTGTGMWAMDYADAHPEAKVIGVDLSPIQSSLVPPNCRFEVDDLEKDWTWEPEAFDFIFCRSLAGSFASWPVTIGKAFNQLEPGGYFEIQDNFLPLLCDDGTLPENSALAKYCACLEEAGRKLGRDVNQAGKYGQWLTEAGFENVTTETYKWPINRWPKEPDMKELGAWSLTAADGGLEGICMALFTRGLGWSMEETLIFCALVRRELRNRKIHAYWQILVAYGKKPEK